MILSDNGADYEPIPTGVQRAVCVNIIDIGLQRSLDGYPVHQAVILWELDAVKKNGQPFTITKRYTASMNEMATIRKHLESWRGRAFSAEEVRNFNTDAIVGKNCRLNLVEKIKAGGKRRVDVESVLPPEKGQSVRGITAKDYIPDWVAKCIADQLTPDGLQVAPRIAPEVDDENDIPF